MKLRIVFLALLFLACFKPAYGYVNPSGLNYFIQLVIAIVIGGLFTIKAVWRRIVFILKRFLLGYKKK